MSTTSKRRSTLKEIPLDHPPPHHLKDGNDVPTQKSADEMKKKMAALDAGGDK
jgi:hypothetical protein